jgi:hypothetical protein
VASNIRRAIVVGDETMQLLKAMRGQLGKTSASRSVDAEAAANSLGMESGTRDFDGRRHQCHNPSVSADIEREVLGGVRPKRFYGYHSGPLSERTSLGASGEDARGYASYGIPSVVEHRKDFRCHPAEGGNDAPQTRCEHPDCYAHEREQEELYGVPGDPPASYGHEFPRHVVVGDGWKIIKAVRTSGVPSRTMLRNVKPNSTFSSLFHASLGGISHHQSIMLTNLSRPFSLPLFTQVRGDTVWKIAEGVSPLRFWRQEAADRASFVPSWQPSESRFGTQSDFPNSFGREILRVSTFSTKILEPTVEKML